MDGSADEGLDGLARTYVQLGLRLGRVVPGLVDAHLGDAAAAERADDGPSPAPEDLRREAVALRRRLVEHPGPRADYLDAQLAACEVVAGRAAGERFAFVDEVRGCLGVDVAPGPEDRYRAAHDALAALLGVPLRRLPAAMTAFRDADRVPPEALRDATAAVLAGLREATAATVGLPSGEAVDLEVVAGAPWAGFTRRVGPRRSVMQVAVDAGHRWTHLPLLAAHEAYPGHHTEAARTEGTVRPERTLLLARTPQSLVAEGAAELGLEAVVGTGWGRWAADRLVGIAGAPRPERAALGEAVEAASEPLTSVRQDAALLLHGSSAVDREERARAHLRRWLLVDDDRADRMLEFLGHPRWRIHTTTYVEGARLVRRWLAARPAGTPAGSRFARLLDESWTPEMLHRDLRPTGDGERYPRHVRDTPMSPSV
ncbi:DUF885 domain-containing protein [Actinomycetospora sp. NBRC 106378]|uniref:DUF885 domain-containing protein n=1 Tax=Actinomycetospora sp. NBRC 106378 TaxID=3032208 RepID=UPI0024A3E0D5|nr:DUF885 domain-containing protein [Actinomycetospora sp. NBRC 106378]GLZ55181.1 hypothetical protein Acsp07_47980 [Actinomycetospora sp. NBRC 106378]